MIYKKIEIKVDGYKETADLYTYFLDNSIEMNINRKRPVVVICPGGGYTMTSDREAEPIAMQYLAKGYHAVILRYSVEPARYPLALLQLAKSVAFLRENAAEFHIDTNKIVIQGFSAGGRYGLLSSAMVVKHQLLQKLQLLKHSLMMLLKLRL